MRKNKFISMASTVCILLFPVASFAEKITTPFDLVSWEYQGDHFQCLLNQNIKKFGDVNFYADSSKHLVLDVKTHSVTPETYDARFYVLRHPWHSDEKPELVIRSRHYPQRLKLERNTEMLLQALAQGSWMQIALSIPSQYNHLLVDVASIGLTEQLEQFNQCRMALPPVAYADIRDISLSFNEGQRVASSSQTELLKQLAHYVTYDSLVERILIDGHTDNVGDRLANLQLSRVRADDVASVLLQAGVKRDLLEVRAHGARYPVADNDRTHGKNKNRRVTVRVLRKQSSQGNKG